MIQQTEFGIIIPVRKMKAELKQLSLEMGKREYYMLQGIPNGERARV